MLLYLTNCCNEEDVIVSETILSPIIENNKKLIDEINTSHKNDSAKFIQYWDLSNSEQIPFKTKKLSTAQVTIFPNYGDRHKLNIKTLYGVCGINQFFMDFDLTSGYVHPYTVGFYHKSSPSDFILFFKRDSKRINRGEISYKRKKDLSPLDSLGQNIGFFRQWKLSDIDIENNKVKMKKNNFGSYYLQVKENSSNKYKPDIPIWSNQPTKNGYIDYSELNILSNHNGGTVVIIWETKNKEIYFIDIHSSINDIVECLIQVSEEYDLDPTLGVYDAAPMARKFKSNSKNNISFDNVDESTMRRSYVGAGFGYNSIQD